MNKLLIVDRPLISVWVYPERKVIHHQMKAHCHGAEFRQALTKGLEAMRLHRATKWLSDDRAYAGQTREDEEWGTTVWLPAAKIAGWKHWAIVQPAKVVGQLNIGRRMKQFAEIGVTARLFADPDEAMKWLVEV